jgi:hypothetical protein
MLAKWRELAASPETIVKIPNLIWTDIAANMLVGTKSMISASASTPVYQVRGNRRRIFLNYFWAIPAFICLEIWILCAALSFVIYLFPRTHSLVRLPALRDLINRLSVGRPLVSAYHQLSPTNDLLSTKEWVSTAGQQMVDLYSTKVPAELEREMDILAATKVTGGGEDHIKQSSVMISERRASV